VKNPTKIKTEIISTSKDLISLFNALNIALGEATILSLWRKAYKQSKSKSKVKD